MTPEYEKQQKKAACQKLEAELKQCRASLNRYADIMADDTLKALKNFIQQDTEFAEAVNQNSQTFHLCIATIILVTQIKH